MSTSFRYVALGLISSVLISGAQISADQATATTAVGAPRRAWEPLDATQSAVVANGRAAQPVTVRFDVLQDAAVNGGKLEIPLSSDLIVTTAITSRHANATDTFLAGPIEGRDGEASLTIVGDALAGRVVVDGRVFIVRRDLNSGSHLVTEADQASFPPEGEPLVPPPSTVAAADALSTPDSNASWI
jgi:hypothetical protein